MGTLTVGSCVSCGCNGPLEDEEGVVGRHRCARCIENPPGLGFYLFPLVFWGAYFGLAVYFCV